MATASAKQASKGKASASNGSNGAEADAALAESAEGKVIEWHGMEISLPPKLRESVIWRWGVLRDGDLAGNARIVESIIGAEQYSAVMDKLDEEGATVNISTDDDESEDEDGEQPTSPMVELIEAAFGAYGLTAGE